MRSNVTLESLELIQDIVERHGPEFDDEDLAATKASLIKRNARAFETLYDKLNLLVDMSAYGFPPDYVLRRGAIVQDMTVDRVRVLADRYLDPADMVWLVVGDAETQKDRLTSLGLGDPIEIDREGNRLP